MDRSAAHNVHLVSAPFSCGVSWLVSVLLELDIRTTHAEPKRYPRGFWMPHAEKPGTDRMVPEGEAHMRFYLPLLRERNWFSFQPGVEVFWEHRLDFARQQHWPVVLFVRDPRDSIYSLYRRNYQHFGWMEYLQRPDLWADHFPGMFGLPPAETWAAWHAFWMSQKSLRPLTLIRFEDSRSRPLSVVSEVLEVLGVSRTQEQQERAIERSSFERTQSVNQSAEQATGTTFAVTRRGKVDEWKETFDSEATQCFGGPASYWMKQLGYAPAVETTDPLAWSTTALSATALSQLTSALKASRQTFDAGDAVRGQTLLEQARSVAGPDDTSRLLLGIDCVASHWTRLVFGDALLDSPESRAAHAAFLDFNVRFAQWPSVRRMLLEGIPQVALVRQDVFGNLNRSFPPQPAEAGISKPVTGAVAAPMLVEASYKGFDLFHFQGRCFAVAQEVAGLDLTQLSPEDLAQHRKMGTVFVADLSVETRERIDAHLKRLA